MYDCLGTGAGSTVVSRGTCVGVSGMAGVPEGPELWRGSGRGLTPLATASRGLGRTNSGKLKRTPGAERTHCAHRDRWCSCGCPGRCPCTPRLRYGARGQSTPGSASGYSPAHRPTTCSTGSSCRPLDARQTQTEKRWCGQPGGPAHALRARPGLVPLVCTPSGVQLAWMTHAHDGRRMMLACLTLPTLGAVLALGQCGLWSHDGPPAASG